MFHCGRKQAFIVAAGFPAGFHNTGRRAEEPVPVTENGRASRSALKSLAAAAEIAEGRRFRFALRKIRAVAEIGKTINEKKRKRLPLPPGRLKPKTGNVQISTGVGAACSPIRGQV